MHKSYHPKESHYKRFERKINVSLYHIALKCLFLKGFQAENAIFALFSPKIRTWQTVPLKVGFFPGFRGLLTD
jgi:hypothetical protein